MSWKFKKKTFFKEQQNNNFRKRWAVNLVLVSLLFPHRFFGSLSPFPTSPRVSPPPSPKIKSKKQFAQYYIFTYIFAFPPINISHFSLLLEKQKIHRRIIYHFFIGSQFTLEYLLALLYLTLTYFTSLPPTRLLSLNPAPTRSLAEWLALSSNHHARARPKHLRNPIFLSNFPLPSNLPHGRSTATAFRKQGDLSHCRLLSSPALSTEVRIKGEAATSGQVIVTGPSPTVARAGIHATLGQ